jgi:hypothetical protein
MSASIENNITNANVSYTFDENPFGASAVTVTVTCNDGYKFETAPTGQLEIPGDAFSDPVELSFTLDSASKVATATGEIETDESYLSITVNGNTVEDTPTPQETTVTNNIADSTESHTVDGESVTINLTGSNEYKRFYNVTVSYGSVTKTIARENKTAIAIKLTDVPVGSNIVINGTYGLVISVENEMTGCSVTGLLPFYLNGETVNVTATANENTSFSDTDKPVFDFGSGFIDHISKTFDLSEDKKTATLSVTLPSDSSALGWNITLTGNTTPDKVITGYGSINVYAVDDSVLNEFAQARFIDKTGETGITVEGDLGEYVVKLHKIFFPVGDVTSTTLKCGNSDTGIKCDSINESVITIDFGDAVLTSENGDSSDFNSKVNVFIPFVGFVAVASDYIGKTLHLSCSIDKVVGTGIYNISVDGETVSQGEFKPVSDVLYRTAKTQDINTIGGKTFNADYLRGLKPYVLIKHYQSLNDNNVNNTYRYITIGDVTGYSKFSNVELTDINCLPSEMAEIISKLGTGVYI